MHVGDCAIQGRIRTVIMGAAGRDFHNFNLCYRDDPGTEVIAFTAAQIPGIAGRHYPPELAGPLYPQGIPIVDENELENLCRARAVQRVVFAYSDVAHEQVMHAASRALAAGADFELLGPDRTMLKSRVPVIAVCAVRTGAGKSQTTRWLAARLRTKGVRFAVVRHPMPYGDLAHQAVQRFATPHDLDAARCTVEEREEYEPHVAVGNLVFAGVDYVRVLAAAEAEADLILWDGGNNDFPFFRPDLLLALVDPTRPGHETAYHPGEAVLRRADVVIVGKTDVAAAGDVAAVAEAARRANPTAVQLRATSPAALDRPELVAGRRVLVIEDGPTITHGGRPTGAGFAAASAAGAAAIVDPRPFAAAAIRQVFDQYPHIGPVLPAVGYDATQLAALRDTIAAAPADVVVQATPSNLAALIPIARPVVRARYVYGDGEPSLTAVIDRFLAARAATGAAP